MKVIIMTKNSAQGGRYGRYLNLALVRLEDGYTGQPAMISERAKGVAEVISVIEPVHAGAHYPHGKCSASRAYHSLLTQLEQL